MARSAAQELTALEVHRAKVLVDGEAVIKDHCDIKVGDQLIVRAGMRIPVDGVVVDGQSDIDRALITGETQPNSYQWAMRSSRGTQHKWTVNCSCNRSGRGYLTAPHG